MLSYTAKVAEISVTFSRVSSGVQRGDSPFGGGSGGWFGVWQIASVSPMRGRHYDAVFPSHS